MVKTIPFCQDEKKILKEEEFSHSCSSSDYENEYEDISRIGHLFESSSEESLLSPLSEASRQRIVEKRRRSIGRGCGGTCKKRQSVCTNADMSLSSGEKRVQLLFTDQVSAEMLDDVLDLHNDQVTHNLLFPGGNCTSSQCSKTLLLSSTSRQRRLSSADSWSLFSTCCGHHIDDGERSSANLHQGIFQETNMASHNYVNPKSKNLSLYFTVFVS